MDTPAETWTQKRVRTKKRILMPKNILLLLATFCIGSGFGFALCYLYFPQFKETETLHLTLRPDSERILGILRIKDSEPQKSIYQNKISVIRDNHYQRMDDGVYPITDYFIHEKFGYGFPRDSQGNIFVVVWEEGVVKIPESNPGNLIIYKGRHIKTEK